MRKLEPDFCLRFNYLAQEGLIAENLQTEKGNNEPISQEEFRASKVYTASYPGDVTVGPLSCLRCRRSAPRAGSLLWKVARTLAQKEAQKNAASSLWNWQHE